MKTSLIDEVVARFKYFEIEEAGRIIRPVAPERSNFVKVEVVEEEGLLAFVHPNQNTIRLRRRIDRPLTIASIIFALIALIVGPNWAGAKTSDYLTINLVQPGYTGMPRKIFSREWTTHAFKGSIAAGRRA